MLVPAADLVDPLYPATPADPGNPADPADRGDAPDGDAVADPALGAGAVAACWLRWKAAGAADDSDEAAMVSVGVDQEDCVTSCSSAQCEAVAGGCGWTGVAIF